MVNKKDDEQRIKQITAVEGITDDQFLEECWSLGIVAAGLAQLEVAIQTCECEGINLVPVKKEFPADYKKIIKLMKEGKLEKALDKIKPYVLAYKTAHLTIFQEGDEMPSILKGPLCKMFSNNKIFH
jgi:hypothetical protein